MSDFLGILRAFSFLKDNGEVNSLRFFQIKVVDGACEVRL
jgi:hypothetical protein